jgi:hypothetical protein
VKIGRKTAYIRSDSRQYILGFDVTTVNQKSGETETRFDPIGFYMSLTALLNALMKFKIRSSTARTLEDLKKEIVKAKEDVMKVYDETINAQLNELNKGDKNHD